MTTKSIQVSTTPVVIVGYHKNRQTLIVTNNAGATLFVNQSAANVTVEGTPVYAGQSIEFNVKDGDEPDQVLYGQTLAGTSDVRFIEGFGGVSTEDDLVPANTTVSKKKRG